MIVCSHPDCENPLGKHAKKFCSLSCAGKRPGIKKIKNCIRCGNRILRHGKKFCNQTCSAIYNNILRGTTNPPKKCIGCNNPLNSRRAQKYCSTRCQKAHQKQTNLNDPNYKWSSATRKKWLIELYGVKCSKCGLTEWNGQLIPIELEHIDGNSNNNNEENVCLLCPNCHAQTPTYKARNKGNGRHFRRERYRQGLSY